MQQSGIAACFGEAHKRAVTTSNVLAGFKKAGIFHFYPYVFEECDFMATAITDR